MVRRTRQTSPSSKGLQAGQVLRRDVLNAWGWVGSEITDSSSITRDHLLATCGFSRRSNHPFCRNQHKSKSRSARSSNPASAQAVNDIIPEDVIVISDGEDEGHKCSKKACKSNPNCLNYLGREKWETEGAIGLLTPSKFVHILNPHPQNQQLITFCPLQNSERILCYSPEIQICPLV